MTYRIALIAVGLFLLAGALAAQDLPPVPEGGLLHQSSHDCTDNASGEVGECFISVDRNYNVYMTFLQNERIQFVRKMVDGGYEELYMRDSFNSF